MCLTAWKPPIGAAELLAALGVLVGELEAALGETEQLARHDRRALEPHARGGRGVADLLARGQGLRRGGAA